MATGTDRGPTKPPNRNRHSAWRGHRMSLPSAWPRLVIAGLFAVTVAVISAAHALSSASQRNAPELALVVFPFNGHAKERVAYNALAASVRAAAGAGEEANPNAALDDGSTSLGLGTSAASLKSLASAAGVTAREAIAHEPLLPRAFAILALSEQDLLRKKTIVERASLYSRRDPILQVLVLEQKGASGDYVGAIDTIDQILRVRPERYKEFFPVLAQALGVKEAVPGFARLLARPLPWRDSFLSFAVNQPGALDPLATVRENIGTVNKDLDQKLVAQLAASGRMSAAERVYRHISKASAPDAKSTVIDWRADYPPFDWKLANEPGFRAQIGDQPDELEINVAPGNGGVIASRLLRNPERPFAIKLALDGSPSEQVKDMTLVLACAGESQAFFERPFAQGANTFAVGEIAACPYVSVAIMARSWTGTQALTGQLSPLRIARN